MHLPSFAIQPIKDTIIIDGEIVEVEKEVVPTNLDSLIKASQRDVRTPRGPLFISISAFPGIELDRTRWGSVYDTLQTLEEFTGKKKVWKMSSYTGAEGSVFLNDQLSIRIGAYFGKSKFETLNLDIHQLAPDSMRFRFDVLDGKLRQYYKYSVGIGYESDTTEVTLNKQVSAFSFIDVPFGLRVFPTGRSNKTTFYVDLGLNARFVSKQIQVPDSYLINANGRCIEEDQLSVAAKSVYTWFQLGVGVQTLIKKNWYLDLRSSMVNFPEQQLYAHPLSELRLNSYSLSVGITRYFSL